MAQSQPTPDVFLRTAQVCARYGGCSKMWIHRRLANDPTFPKPAYFGARRHWRLSDLVRWESTQTTTPKSKPHKAA